MSHESLSETVITVDWYDREANYMFIKPILFETFIVYWKKCIEPFKQLISDFCNNLTACVWCMEIFLDNNTYTPASSEVITPHDGRIWTL